MRYKGVEITVIKRENAKLYMIKSPINQTTRIFNNKERLKNYIDNAEDLEAMAKAMRD